MTLYETWEGQPGATSKTPTVIGLLPPNLKNSVVPKPPSVLRHVSGPNPFQCLVAVPKPPKVPPPSTLMKKRNLTVQLEQPQQPSSSSKSAKPVRRIFQQEKEKQQSSSLEKKQKQEPIPRGSIKKSIHEMKKESLVQEPSAEVLEGDLEWYTEEEDAHSVKSETSFKQQPSHVVHLSSSDEEIVPSGQPEIEPAIEEDNEEETNDNAQEGQRGDTWQCVKCKFEIADKEDLSPEVKKPWHRTCWDAHVLTQQLHSNEPKPCQGCQKMWGPQDKSKWNQSKSKRWWCEECWDTILDRNTLLY